jgi:hypothetical protein
VREHVLTARGYTCRRELPVSSDGVRTGGRWRAPVGLSAPVRLSTELVEQRERLTRTRIGGAGGGGRGSRTQDLGNLRMLFSQWGELPPRVKQ